MEYHYHLPERIKLKTDNIFKTTTKLSLCQLVLYSMYFI